MKREIYCKVQSHPMQPVSNQFCTENVLAIKRWATLALFETVAAS